MRSLLALSTVFASLGALQAQSFPATNYGQGCPQPPAFYELFETAGSGDLSGSSLRFVLVGGGQYRVTQGSGIDGAFANDLGLSDDSLSGQTLSNPFPVPADARGNSTAITVSSNGWVGLFDGDFSGTGADASESVAEFLAESPRIAAYWDDYNPGRGGAVYFDARPGYDMVTWNQVPQFATTDSNTFQCKLYPNGDFELSWGIGCNDDGIIGLSMGGGVGDPGSSDLSSSNGNTLGGDGIPVALDGTLPIIGGPNWDLNVSNVPASATLAVMNLGLSQTSVDLTPLGAPGCLGLAPGDITLPLTVVAGSANLNLPSPNDPALNNATLYAQALIADPMANALGVVTTNGARIDVVPAAVGVNVVCQGSNTFNSNTSSGFFQITNSNASGLSIDSITFDWVNSSNPSQNNMEFDCDQTGMANTFSEGNSGSCSGTYRNGSDVACGLDYANALNNLNNPAACGSSVAHCQAQNQVNTTPDYRTVTWRFTAGTFANGLTFEFDLDTDGGAGVGGDDMAGLVVTVVMSDGTTVSGEVAAAGADLGTLSL